MAKFGVSERLAFRVLGQRQSTHCNILTGRSDDAALTSDMIALDTAYGRCGYRRITALLWAAGWMVNVKRVEWVRGTASGAEGSGGRRG